MQRITAKEVTIITRAARLKRAAVMNKAKRKAAAQKKKYEWFLESPACPKGQEDLPDLEEARRLNRFLQDQPGITNAYSHVFAFHAHKC